MMLFRRISASKIVRKSFLNVGTVTANRTLYTCRYRNFITHTENSSNTFCMNRALFKYSTQATKDSANVTGNENENENKNDDGSNELEYDTDLIFEEIAQGDPEILKKLKLIEFEIAVLKDTKFDVPEKLKKKHWIDLLSFQSPNQRKRFLHFIRLNEYKTLSILEKKKIETDVRRKWQEEKGFHYYGLAGHAMFLRIYERSLQKLLMQRQQMAEMEIVIDCSYQEYMSEMNVRLCAKQLAYCLFTARRHRYPSSLKFCNFSQRDKLGEVMPSYFQPFYNGEFCTVHEGSYLDFYPKERLVYLSPHATSDLVDVNSDVLIIGAFVDRGTGLKISLAKAKENNIRMAKFPIDQYLYWKQGQKSLPVNVVHEIILNMAFYRDWRRALKLLGSKSET